MNLLRPCEVLEEHPDIARHWTAGNIGALRSMGLIRGKKYRNTHLVFEKDVIELFKLLKK